MSADAPDDDGERPLGWVHLLHDLTALNARAQSLSQALQGTVDRLSREFGWPVAHYFVPQEDGVLEFAGGIWKLPGLGGHELILATRAARYPPGEGWVGEAAARAAPLALTDLEAMGGRFDEPRLPAALGLGLSALFVQPVVLGDEVLAVMELFSERPLPSSTAFRDVMAQAATHLGSLAARRRAEEQLRLLREEKEAARRGRAQFLVDLGHRIRTPMNAVIGMTELLLRTRLTAQQQDFAATVRAAGDDVMQVIADAFEFLGIDFGAAVGEPAIGEAGGAEARPDGKPREDVPERPLRVLVVEDNPINQKVALKILEALGHRAEVAASGREALDVLEQRPFDVVMMDIEMPELDGLETTRRIRRARPADEQPRIIAMTARAMPGDRDACLAAGMDDYLGKPVTVASLRRALER